MTGKAVRTLWLKTMRLKDRQSKWGWMSGVMLQAVGPPGISGQTDQVMEEGGQDRQSQGSRRT